MPSKSRASDAELIERQTAWGLATHARDFLQAAKAIVTAIGLDHERGGLRKTGVTHPLFCLCAHSIELSMKSVLLANGRSHVELKKIGHNLLRAYDEVAQVVTAQSGKDMLAAYREDIELISPYYAAKTLEYRMTGHFRYPRANNLLDCARECATMAYRIARSTRRGSFPAAQKN